MSRPYEGMSLREVTEHLFLSDEPAAADLIFVFGGKRRERAERAAELYRECYALRIVVTGGDRRGTGGLEAEVLREVLLAGGVPESAILLETRPASTTENVLAGRAALAAAGWLERLEAAPRPRFPGVAVRCCPDRRMDITAANWSLSAESRQLVYRELEKVPTHLLKGDA